MTPTSTDPLDLDAIRRWLADRTELTGELEAALITGGRSNLTYLVRDAADRRFVLRRPPMGDLLPGAHDVGREFRITSALHAERVPVPEPVAHCDDPTVTGAEFTVAAYVEGLALRRADQLPELTQEGRRRVTDRFAEVLAALHRVDPAVSGRDLVRGHDYVRRQLKVWQRQLDAAPGRELPRMRELGQRLHDLAPPQRHVAIVHGDYRLDNVLVAASGDVLAIIDWELWTLGDPLADLGAALAYWVQPGDDLDPFGEAPTTSPELGDRADVLAAYAEAQGLDLSEEDVAYHVAFGTWRFAAILEGVYRRNLTGTYGDTEDDGWRRFEHVVPALAERAAEHLAAV